LTEASAIQLREIEVGGGLADRRRTAEHRKGPALPVPARPAIPSSRPPPERGRHPGRPSSASGGLASAPSIPGHLWRFAPGCPEPPVPRWRWTSASCGCLTTSPCHLRTRARQASQSP
jgi:hypothetical protein